ncbi:hypothetical protein PSI23_20430 [Xenorhabdus sp. XENO-10]|uniref:Uncharacterized protein n=1 Tax=Xenorhabdus yunnanensis TaxID=3025878 RepID=A0ABT5LKD2_9GAMM|nr:hypothetical protein [Xenorhabdus yunnanensis]MDC9591580.1 hypothetical protein [Xenorhabdus yunnanensis]
MPNKKSTVIISIPDYISSAAYEPSGCDADRSPGTHHVAPGLLSAEWEWQHAVFRLHLKKNKEHMMMTFSGERDVQ